MKVNKTQATMFILSLLLKNKELSKSDVLGVLEISSLTFSRYIQEIKAYLLNFNVPYEIKYFRCNDKYRLISSDDNIFN